MSNRYIYGVNSFATTSHYVYRITNIVQQKHYYGVRQCDRCPKDDLGIIYFGSPASKKNKWIIKDQKRNPKNYKYKIISVHKNRESANEREIILHLKFSVKDHDSFYNETNQTSTGFQMHGRVTCIDSSGKTLQVHKNDIRLINGEVNSIVKNMCTMRNKTTGETKRIQIFDPILMTGEWIQVLSGRRTMKNIKTGETKSVKKTEKIQSDWVQIQTDRKVSDLTKRKMSETRKTKIGESSPNTKYIMITPWGTGFAQKWSNMIEPPTLSYMCKNGKAKMTFKFFNKLQKEVQDILTDSSIGENFSRLGFSRMKRE